MLWDQDFSAFCQEMFGGGWWLVPQDIIPTETDNYRHRKHPKNCDQLVRFGWTRVRGDEWAMADDYHNAQKHMKFQVASIVSRIEIAANSRIEIGATKRNMLSFNLQ